MNRSPLSPAIKQLCDRAVSGGGFGLQKGGDFRPDATAWAAIALTALDVEKDLKKVARQRLSASQLADGRVSVSQDHPQSFWPTCLAVLAWQGDSAFKEPLERAATFLLATSGLHWKKKPDAVFGHDTDLKGCPGAPKWPPGANLRP